MIISFLSNYTTYCTKRHEISPKYSTLLWCWLFLYLRKPVWQVTAYLEITFWWKVLISPLCSSPLTYRNTSNLYLNVRIKLLLFCWVKESKQTSTLWKIFAKKAIGWHHKISLSQKLIELHFISEFLKVKE